MMMVKSFEAFSMIGTRLLITTESLALQGGDEI
jgi:hypothetical protein